MSEELEKAGYHPADVNGDHKVDEEEKEGLVLEALKCRQKQL